MHVTDHSNRFPDSPALSVLSKCQEFQAHKKQGKGIISQVTDSIHNMGASYMMKNRPAEFALMHEYINIFGEKLGVMDRIATRVLREQAGLFGSGVVVVLVGWLVGGGGGINVCLML